MNVRKSLLILVMLGAWTPASGQSPNLLKNPGGDQASEHWRAFHDAKVEYCPTGGRCFVLRGGGYFIQEVTIPAEAVGQYALLIGRAHSESPTVRPSLYGYMMNSGDPSGGRIYAYLSGQQMTGSGDSSNQRTLLWGIFRVKPGTGRISFFLQQARQRGIGHDGAATRFDDLGLYIVPSEQEARSLVSQLVPGAQFGPANAPANNTHCRLSGAVIPSLYGIQVGMSLQDVISRFPEAINEKSVVRALELSEASTTGRVGMLIENRSASENLKEVKRFAFQFHKKHLFSLTVELHSPQWKDVEEFIDQRADLLSLLDLPQASAWEPVEGKANVGKYLICNGIEIRFYAAPRGSANVNLVSLADITVEREFAAASDLQP